MTNNIAHQWYDKKINSLCKVTINYHNQCIRTSWTHYTNMVMIAPRLGHPREGLNIYNSKTISGITMAPESPKGGL